MTENSPSWMKLIGESLTLPLFHIGDKNITALSFLSLTLLIYLTFRISKMVQRAMESAAKARQVPLDGSFQSAQRLVHYVIVSLGVIVAIEAAGVDLSSLVAAGAVFAVGVGLALQSLAQNFVSGLILLLERSIKPGDILEVQGNWVHVEELGLRSTIVETLDDTRIIIPNSLLVQSMVSNATFKNQAVRVRAPVGVSYDSDLVEVKRILLELGASLSWSLASPPPAVLVRGFDASNINVELSVWTDEPWVIESHRSELFIAIWKTFKEKGVVIAFPQLDLHVIKDHKQAQPFTKTPQG